MTADLKNEAQKALDAYDKYESHRDALQFAAAIESLRKAVELQAPAEAHGEIVAWMYEHDGCNDEPILTVDRWPECREPWNETPLDVLALAKHAIEKVWLDAVCTDHGEHSISEAARTRVEFAADALKLGLRLTGVKPSAVPAPRIGKWGHCWTCNHDAIPGEGCARSQCPMLAAKTVPEPAWYAVTSLRAPCIDKVIRRLDVAEEYADKQREVWTDVEIVPLYTQPVPVADKPGARFIEKTNREYIAWCKTKYIPESLDERGMKSLDGLWAWQAQEHRYATQSNPQPKHTEAPAVDSNVRRAAESWRALTETMIDAYLEDYEMVGEDEGGRDACYAPTEGERSLIKDAIMGLLSEADSVGYTMAGAAPSPAPAQSVTAEHQRILHEAQRIGAAETYFNARAWVLDTSANRRIFEAGFDAGAESAAPAPAVPCAAVGAEPATREVCGRSYVEVRTEAVDWLKKHYPALCEKSGLCERIGGHLYTRSVTPAPKSTPLPLTKAATDVLAERQRQISAEGWTPEHDDQHADGSLALAAGCYALHHDDPGLKGAPAWWPWHAAWWKPKDRYRNLVKAGALIVAELERLRRAGHPPEQKTGEQP